MIAGYDANTRSGTPDPVARGKEVFVDLPSPRRASRRASLVSQYVAQQGTVRWAGSRVRVPSLMIMAEIRSCVARRLRPTASEKIIPDLEKYLFRGSAIGRAGKPDEVSAKLIEWRRRRFG